MAILADMGCWSWVGFDLFGPGVQEDLFAYGEMEKTGSCSSKLEGWWIFNKGRKC